MNPLQVLQERFDFDDFRPGQREVIDTLLSGESAAAVFPTGAGKSLCFQLPAVMFQGMTLVVSPLLALMKDQVDALRLKGVQAERLDSSLTAEEYADVLGRARAGELKILYVAPERFNNERFRQSLRQFRVSLMAVDEAHCVSEWGHNFRPDYLKLSRYAQACGAERVLTLTATATPRVLEDICRGFSIKHAVRTPFHRPNLHLRAFPVSSAGEKLSTLVSTLKKRGPGSSIVYVTLQRTAEEVAGELQRRGLPARPYHAGLDNEIRVETQEWFLQSEDGIVVATIAFGMGIDKPDIRAVYHFDPPKSLENYSQEIGRAGRDGKPALCQFTYFPPDRIPLENFVYGDTPTKAALESLLTDIFQGPEELVLNLYQMSRDHDLKPLVLRTTLTYLELDGYLEALTPVYSSYRFKPSAPSREILTHYPQEARFIADILKHSVKKRIWFEIDIDAVATALGCERSRVVGALDRLGLDGWMEIKASDLRFRYRRLQMPESIKNLAGELFKKAGERETAEIDRLNQALTLATHQGCLARYLSRHFGEELERDCGECSFCLGEARELPGSFAEEEIELGPVPPELTDAREVARFLCGLSSPSLRKSRLTSHPRFGALEGVSFERVLERAGG